jgi:hypothetical protein
MAFSKYLLLLLLSVAALAFLWAFGRPVFKGITKWVLWALAALCACAGAMTFLNAEGRPLALIGGFVLWVFAAYSIKIAESLPKRS